MAASATQGGHNNSKRCSFTAELVIFGVLNFSKVFLPKFGCHGNVSYTLAIRNVFFELAHHENPVISHHIVVSSSPRHASYNIFVPEFVALVTPLCPLYTGVP